MSADVFSGLERVIAQRRENPAEGSYTCYLFSKGMDKILKKVGEEASEVIIAAKNGDNSQTVEEICDLAYHVMVMMNEAGISADEVRKVLEERSRKIGNLKTMHQSDHNT